LDKSGQPIQDAMMWMDVRAIDEANEIAESGDPALRYVGNGRVSAEWFPCKALWIKRHSPDVYERATTIFEQTDWLAFVLTGELTTNINTKSIRWFYDQSRGGLPRSLYQCIGLEDIFPKIPERTVVLGEIVGSVTADIAREFGFRKGIPVAGGGADAFVGMVGVNALKPGRMSLITGSSHLQLALSEAEVHAPGIFGSYPDAVLPGLHVVEAGQISTGSVVKWFKDTFVESASAGVTSGRSNISYKALDEEAARIHPGSDGLVVLEHWQGNRTPWVDPTSRGVIRGLTLSHTRAHVYRAILEAIVYGTTVILDRFRTLGIHVTELVACGGATRSPFWMKLHADITGKTILVPEEQEAVSLGSAILAATATGAYGSIEEAANHMVRIRTRVEPDLSLTEEYEFYVEQYRHMYMLLKDDSQATVNYSRQQAARFNSM